MGTLYAEQGAPYCARESRGKDMRREDTERKEMKESAERGRGRREREREKKIRKVHRSDEEETEEKEEEVATGQSPRARIYITVPALTHGYT